MKYSKRLISALLASAMLVQPAITAFAESTTDSSRYLDSSTYESYADVDNTDTSEITRDSDFDNSDISEVVDSQEIEVESEQTSDNASETTETPIKQSNKAITNIDDELGDYVFEGDSLPCSENDPSYHKYMSNVNSRNNMRAIWGSNNLTHQSRFSNYNKVYGIDVSYYQYTIDWNKVKAAGVEYAIIRVGYRGYGNGALVLDSRFHEYIKGAKAAGLKVGVYFYTQAINTTEAKAEANFVLNAVKNYSLDLPVYYDIESVDFDSGRLDNANLTKAQHTALCTAFADTIKAAGYQAGIYANKNWLTYKIDGVTLGQKYPVWLANYTTYTDYSNNFNMWQYSGSGSVNGISTYVDMNVKYELSNVSKPNKVSKPVYKSYTTKTLTVSWNKPSGGCAGYEVALYNTSTGAYTTVGTTTGTSYTIPNLSTGTTYNVVVRAYNGSGTSKAYGAYSDYQTLTTKVAYPKNFRCASKSETACTLAWDKSNGATSYKIYEVVNGKEQLIGTTASTSYTISNVAANSTHKYTIRPFKYLNGKDWQGAAPAEPITVKFAKEAPKNFTVKGYTKDAVRIGWDNIAGASAYNVYMLDSVTNTYKFVAKTNTNEYRFSKLKENTYYKVKVQAVYSNNSQGPLSAIYTLSTKPTTPTGLKKTSTTQNSVNLSWNAVNGTTFYRIYMYNNSTGKYTKKVDVYDKTSITISGLEKGSRYRFKVCAIRITDIKNYLSAQSNNISIATNGVKYYKKADQSHQTLYSAFNSLGIPTSYALQVKIAKTNGIGAYTGTAAQNTQMLNLLKSGKLMIPQ